MRSSRRAVDALRLTPLDPVAVEGRGAESPIAGEERGLWYADKEAEDCCRSCCCCCCWWRINGEVDEEDDVVPREGLFGRERETSEEGGGCGGCGSVGGEEVDRDVAVNESEGEESREGLPGATTRARGGRELRG
jgi:hypothetical protein